MLHVFTISLDSDSDDIVDFLASEREFSEFLRVTYATDRLTVTRRDLYRGSF